MSEGVVPARRANDGNRKRLRLGAPGDEQRGGPLTSEAQDTTKGPTTAAVEDEGTTELLRAAVEAAVDGFLVTDETGRVVFANPAVEK